MRAGALHVLLLLALALLSACSVTVGAPAPTPGPGEPTFTPLEQVHFDVTPAPSPTAAPPTGTAAPLPPGVTPGQPAKYTVKPGDTLSGIALEFDVSVDDIVKANNLTDPNSIYEGQVLTIPAKGSSPSNQGPSATPTKGP